MEHLDNNEIIVGLDIGTTKICAIVGQKDINGRIEILGMGKSESRGVMRGIVTNIEKTVQSIKEAVAEAAAQSGVDIKLVNVGIAGKHITSMQHRGILTRNNSQDEIVQSDIDQLISDMHKLALGPGERIIHILPQEYMVDNEHDIKDPVGMSGNRLEANFHIITGQVAAAQNIEKCVTRAGLKMSGLTLEPIASSAAVLDPEEMEAGIALVDIGGGTTDIAIFQEGIIRHSAVIPFGGNIITEDIKTGCMVMRNQAEALKQRFGSALALETQEHEIISIPGLRGRESREISVRNLSHIIQSRMEEIFEQVFFSIKSSGYSNKLIGGVVITGGGAQLKHLKQLVEYITGLDTRIGYPIEHLTKGFDPELRNPIYSTGVGLIMKGMEQSGPIEEPEMQTTVEPTTGDNNKARKWWGKMQEWFTDESANGDFN